MLISVSPFGTHLNFLDPQKTPDGKPYGPIRYKEIVQERFYISKNLNTSYADTGNITPTEKEYLIDFIIDDIKRQKAQIEALKNS